MPPTAITNWRKIQKLTIIVSEQLAIDDDSQTWYAWLPPPFPMSSM